jgi:hypothetical protein
MLIIDDLRTDVILIIAAVGGGVLHELGFSAGLPMVIVSAVWMLCSYAIVTWTVLQHPRLRT